MARNLNQLLTENSGGISFLQILFMMIYVMHVVTHIFICCYVADKLRDEVYRFLCSCIFIAIIIVLFSMLFFRVCLSATRLTITNGIIYQLVMLDY